MDDALTVEQQRSLAPLCWFGTGGAAQFYVEPRTLAELVATVRRATAAGLPLRVLGEGANVLIPDEGVRGFVLRLVGPEFECVSRDGSLVVAGGGVKLSRLIAYTISEGLSGLEGLAGVPASVGGACVCNAGGKEVDIGLRVAWIDVLSGGKVTRLTAQDVKFDYRASGLGQSDIVMRAAFKLRAECAEVVRAHYVEALRTKKARQPLDQNSGGCAFKNPRGLSARALIAEAGLAGYRIGGASVAPSHANFLVTGPGATSSDISRLMDDVQVAVHSRFGVMLEPELHLW